MACSESIALPKNPYDEGIDCFIPRYSLEKPLAAIRLSAEWTQKNAAVQDMPVPLQQFKLQSSGNSNVFLQNPMKFFNVQRL